MILLEGKKKAKIRRRKSSETMQRTEETKLL